MIEYPNTRRRRASVPVVVGLLVLAFLVLGVVLWTAWSGNEDSAALADPEAAVQPAEVPAPLPPARGSPPA
jgi:hypothetical protein